MRDTQRVQGVLTFQRSEWAGFVAGVQGLVADDDPAVQVRQRCDGVLIGHAAEDGSLIFTPQEWDVFIEGVQAGEFNL